MATTFDGIDEGDYVSGTRITDYMDVSGNRSIRYPGWLKIDKVELTERPLMGAASIMMLTVRVEYTVIFDLVDGIAEADAEDLDRTIKGNVEYPLAALHGQKPTDSERTAIGQRRTAFLQLMEPCYAYTSSPFLAVSGKRGIKAPDGQLQEEVERDGKIEQVLAASWQAAKDYTMADGWGQPEPGCFPVISRSPSAPAGQAKPDFWYWNLQIVPQKAWTAKMKGQIDAAADMPGASGLKSETWGTGPSGPSGPSDEIVF